MDVHSSNLLPLDPLEKQVFTWLVHERLHTQKYLIGVSGGVDSVALFHLMYRLSQVAPLSIAIAHIHHGEDPSDCTQTEFRDSASIFVKKLADKMGTPFFSAIAESGTLKSEKEARRFRRTQWRGIAEKAGISLIMTAHSSTDLLETRLMRLIRGSGPQGLTAISKYKDGYVRPFLDISRDEIEAYARRKELTWLEDPSNRSTRFLRNWIRHRWIPKLKQRVPGSEVSLAHSLQTIAESFRPRDDEAWFQTVLQTGGIDRVRFTELRREDKRRVLAHYFRNANIANYTVTHIDEVMKRLDSLHSELKFKTAGRTWIMTASSISIIPEKV